MRREIFAGALALGLFLSGPVLADTVANALTPEQRAGMFTYITEQNIAPATLEGDVVVGYTVPETVVLNPVPDTWGPDLVTYQYVYANDRVILVDKGNRQVVAVIEK